MKNIFYILSLILFLNFTSLNAQHIISGKLKPKGENNLMLLYKTEGAFQYYKASTEIDSIGMFGFRVPEKFESGSYRLVYNTQENLYINIIYNQEDVSFICNPEDVINSIYFFDSKENSYFFDYIKKINEQYESLDSIQKLFYTDATNTKLAKKYIAQNAEITAYQNYFEKESSGMMVNNFIKAYKRTHPEQAVKSKLDNYQYLKVNFLNNIDFKNKTLQNSSFIIDRLNEYVFDLNEAIAKATNSSLDINMIDLALEKIPASEFKNEVIYSLTSSAFDPYSSKYDILLDYLHKKYYGTIPEDLKNKDFTLLVESKLKVIVGKKSPNIKFDENNSLHDIESEKTLVIFWSTTCSHCLEEIPQVYNLLLSNFDIKVVLVAIEDSNSDWENVILEFPIWKHYKAEGKWQNEYAKAYNVKSTPSYFILDKNKFILEKPENFNSLKLSLSK